MIARARHRGSVPPDVARRLRHAQRRQRLAHVVAEATVGPIADLLAAGPPGTYTLTLDAAPGTLQVDRVVLATGFEAQRPGSPWLDAAIERHGLTCAACGYPVVDASLGWAEGLYVTGPLAELEIGPVARNIVGARLAAKRLEHLF